MLIWRFMALIALALVVGRLAAAEPSAEPILRIEVGFHTAEINRVVATADGGTLLSASDDKTLRTWLWDGRHLDADAVYRAPIAPGNEGKLYVCALSPDGRWVLAGGWTGYDWDRTNCIYLIDRRSGQLVRRLGDLPGVVRDLRLSPAGDRVLASIGGKGGVRCLSVPEGQALWSDADYGDDSYGACWLPDGGCVTTCADGELRRYDAQGQRQAKVKAPDGQQPHAIDQLDGLLAVTYDDATAISLLDAGTLAANGQLDVAGGDDGKLSNVCAAEGRWWAARNLSGTFELLSWPGKGGERTSSPGQPGAVWWVCPLAAGTARPAAALALMLSDTSLRIVDASGDIQAAITSERADLAGDLYADALGQRVLAGRMLLDFAVGSSACLGARQRMWLAQALHPQDPQAANALAWDLLDQEPRDPLSAVALARAALAMPDGDQPHIRDTLAEALFQLNHFAAARREQEQAIAMFKAATPDDEAGRAPYEERLRKIDAAKAAGVPAAIPPRQKPFRAHGQALLQCPPASVPGLEVQLGDAPTINDKPVALDPGESADSFAIPRSRQLVILSTNWNLRAAALDGDGVWQQAAPGSIVSLHCPTQAPVVIAAYNDGTLRWYRLSDGVEVLACFAHQDGKRWVAWTPSGYYWASPGGEDLIGWHINRGKDQLADFYPASRFRDRFNRPDIVHAVFETWDEAKAIELAARTQQVEGGSVAAVLPPVVEILAPDEGGSVGKPQVELRLRVRTAADAPMTGLRVLFDGQELSQERGLRPADGGDTITRSITIPAHSGVLSVVAENRHAASVPATRRIAWSGALAPIKPVCYVLAVGISGYRNPGIEKLTFPAADAQAIADAFKTQQDRLFREVQAQVIVDGDRLAVMKGLKWLSTSSTSEDYAVLFLAGHGENNGRGAYHFLPTDAEPDQLEATAVPFTAILDCIQALPGHRLAFLDTCRAGNVTGGMQRRGMDNAAVQAINQLASAENGCVVFAAATAKEAAMEQESWGHGAFTLAIIEAMQGRAPAEGGPLLTQICSEPMLTVNRLNLYVAERVKQLTGGAQHTTMERSATVPDFPVALHQ